MVADTRPSQAPARVSRAALLRARSFTAYVFPLVVALLLWGPQDRDHNALLNAFWAWWWPGIFLVYPFLGRIWCAGE